MNNGQRIEAVLKSLPYSKQITEINLTEENAIKFNWRGTTFRVSMNLHVEEVRGGCLERGNTVIILEELLKKSKLLSELNQPEEK